jgi:hypothetical protein|tara:strand:- start:18 stop:119 length:102 start_codon:yes stop_codon:yes gene_type:complete
MGREGKAGWRYGQDEAHRFALLGAILFLLSCGG